MGIVEAFDLPIQIESIATETAGDGDGHVEPGEDAALSITLTSHELDLTGISAHLTVDSTNTTVIAATAVLPDLPAGGSATAGPAFTFRVDPDFPGFTDARFTLHVNTDQGGFDELIAIRIGNPGDYPPDITDITEAHAVIQWTTGIPADGQVHYGTSTNYSESSALDPTLRRVIAALLSVGWTCPRGPARRCTRRRCKLAQNCGRAVPALATHGWIGPSWPAARRRSHVLLRRRPAFAGWQSRPGSGYAWVDRPVVVCGETPQPRFGVPPQNVAEPSRL